MRSQLGCVLWDNKHRPDLPMSTCPSTAAPRGLLSISSETPEPYTAWPGTEGRAPALPAFMIWGINPTTSTSDSYLILEACRYLHYAGAIPQGTAQGVLKRTEWQKHPDFTDLRQLKPMKPNHRWQICSNARCQRQLQVRVHQLEVLREDFALKKEAALG